jgi:tRNA-specific 2-thiouridylase
MSGGVDSSFAASLLLEQGFAVEGVTMKLTAGICCDIGAAQQVCHHLSIPHRIVDMQQVFEQDVVRNFVDEYRSGRTPNPCIRCNDSIKFQALLAYAKEEGFAYLATGHYARREHDDRSGRFALKTGTDPKKDQSYFLYRLTQDQLGRVLFPLGGLRKSDVKRRARELRLPAATRPESQEICFVPDNDYRSFLKEHAPDVLRQGEIVMTDGTVVGKHEGIAFYTVGQRRGLGVASEGRLYVIKVDPLTSRVVLGQRKDLETSHCMVSEPHFLAFDRLDAARSVGVRVRYRAAAVKAVIAPGDGKLVSVSFSSPVTGVTPGQAAVFYDGDTVIGGGIIER